jgi:D-sedoheptulose 7-phosphate isomerase
MFDKRIEILSKNKEYFESFIIYAAGLISSTLVTNNKIMFCGNGGSAAESQHMAAEYAATLDSKRPRDGYAAIALTTDTSFITAWSNDFGFESVFSRQISSIGNQGDLLICYSTSGNSKNVLEAVIQAKKQKINYLIFTGNNKESFLAKFSDKKNIVYVPSSHTPIIQEVHTMLGHDICYNVEQHTNKK